MIELEGLPPLSQPVLVAAFEGWNDAAEAATGLIDHVLAEFPGQRFADVDPEDYYDFQVNRPIISVGRTGSQGDHLASHLGLRGQSSRRP